MATQGIKLYVDVDRGVLVESLTSRNIVKPTFVQGDTVTLQIYLLERNTTGGITSPYSKSGVSGKALRVGIGTPTAASGSGAPGIYQTTFTADTTNNVLTGNLYITPATVTSLLGSATSKDATLEIEKAEGGLYQTVFQGPCLLLAELIEAAAPPAPEDQDSFMTAAETTATFVKWNNTETEDRGKSIVLTSPDGTHTVSLWVDNDGVFHADAT